MEKPHIPEPLRIYLGKNLVGNPRKKLIHQYGRRGRYAPTSRHCSKQFEKHFSCAEDFQSSFWASHAFSAPKKLSVHFFGTEEQHKRIVGKRLRYRRKLRSSSCPHLHSFSPKMSLRRIYFENSSFAPYLF